jgi:hypothetical protein
MLKITDSGIETFPRVVRLEGKLLEAWIDEIRGLFAGSDPRALPALDLSDLSYVDRPGTEFLRQLQREGVRIESCSPFVRELLKPGPSSDL